MLYALGLTALLASTFIMPDGEWWREWSTLFLAYTAGLLVERWARR